MASDEEQNAVTRAQKDAADLIEHAVNEAHIARIGMDWLDVLESRLAQVLVARDLHAQVLNGKIASLAGSLVRLRKALSDALDVIEILNAALAATEGP